MALINCPECSTEVSDTALKCPKCGVQLRKAKRSIFGKIIKWIFIGFNILMTLWLIDGTCAVSKTVSNLPSSGVEQAGAAIGTGIAAMMLFTIWVIGDIILGILTLLTRPKS